MILHHEEFQCRFGVPFGQAEVEEGVVAESVRIWLLVDVGQEQGEIGVFVIAKAQLVTCQLWSSVK